MRSLESITSQIAVALAQMETDTSGSFVIYTYNQGFDACIGIPTEEDTLRKEIDLSINGPVRGRFVSIFKSTEEGADVFFVKYTSGTTAPNIQVRGVGFYSREDACKVAVISIFDYLVFGTIPQTLSDIGNANKMQ